MDSVVITAIWVCLIRDTIDLRDASAHKNHGKERKGNFRHTQLKSQEVFVGTLHLWLLESL